MSSITTWLWGTSQLDDAVDKATSELLPSGAEDIALNLEICDQIRSKSIPAKDAMRSLKRRIDHKNPNVQLLALALTDTCIKNGGDHFLLEVASREFMDDLVSILKIPTLNIEVKNTILRLVQNWATAFEGKATLQYVGQVCKNLKSEGFKFPPRDLAVANSAMVDTQTAPEWIDSDVCLRCRTPFTFTNRKHHCRNCGQVFDQLCSAKTMSLPHFGITQEVRVCDGCYSKLSKKGEKTNGIDKTHRHSTSHPGSRHRSAREVADAELQRAIQLSLQESGTGSGHARPGYVSSQPPAWQYSEPPLVDRATQPNSNSDAQAEEDDPDLRAAIEASLREANAPRPSAPIVVETPRTEQTSFSYGEPIGYSQSYPPGVVPPHPSMQVSTYDLQPMESDAILTFSQTVEQVQGQGGRDMSRFPAVNELYDKASGLRPKLAMSLDDTGRKEQMLSDMNDKLSQAVKLYDKLLTEQVSQPRWRLSQQPASSVSNNQANRAYSAGYSTLNGYNQWVPSQSHVQQPLPSSPEFPPQQPQRSYSIGPPVQEYQQPRQPVSSPVQGQAYLAESSSPQWNHQQQLQYTEPTQYQPLLTPTPAPSQPPIPHYNSATPQQQQFAEFPPQSSSGEPSEQPQYAQQQPQQYSAPTPGPQYSPSQISYQNPAPAPVSLPVSPQYAPPPTSQSPVSSKSHPPPSPVLTRQNTVSYASPPPHSQPQAANNLNRLSRHNTVAHTPPSNQTQYHQPQQLHAAPPSLPAFPVAPTSAPQTFSLYGQSVPLGVAQQPERKEAFLIDL